MPGITLRYYQMEALDAIRGAFRDGQRSQCLELPVGSGKTIVFAALTYSWLHTERFQGRPVVVLAHRGELVSQAAEKIRWLNPEARIAVEYEGGHTWTGAEDVLVATIQTLHDRLRRSSFPHRRWGLIVLDEAHHGKAKTFRETLGYLGWRSNPSDIPDDRLFLGVTATPDEDTFAVFPHAVYRKDMLPLIQEGYLKPLTGIRVNVDMDLSGVARGENGDYREEDLGRLLNTENRNEIIVQTHQLWAKRRRTLVFTATVDHAEDLAQAFRAAGVAAEGIHGKMSSRVQSGVLSRFTKGETQVVCNAALLTEGFDAPFVNGLVLARPTLSRTLYKQMLGRGTRRFPGEADCLVMDVADATKKHSLTLDDMFPPLGDKPWQEPGEETKRRVRLPRPAGGEVPEKTEVLMVGKQVSVTQVDLFAVTHASDTSKFAWLAMGDSMYCFVGQGQRVVLRPQGEGYIAYWDDERTGVETPLMEAPMDPAWAQGIAEEWMRHEKPDAMALVQRRARWREQKPSDKQLEHLTRFGLEAHVGYLTRGEAADLLAACFMFSKTTHQAAHVVGAQVWEFWTRTHDIA